MVRCVCLYLHVHVCIVDHGVRVCVRYRCVWMDFAVTGAVGEQVDPCPCVPCVRVCVGKTVDYCACRFSVTKKPGGRATGHLA